MFNSQFWDRNVIKFWNICLQGCALRVLKFGKFKLSKTACQSKNRRLNRTGNSVLGGKNHRIGKNSHGKFLTHWTINWIERLVFYVLPWLKKRHLGII